MSVHESFSAAESLSVPNQEHNQDVIGSFISEDPVIQNCLNCIDQHLSGGSLFDKEGLFDKLDILTETSNNPKIQSGIEDLKDWLNSIDTQTTGLIEIQPIQQQLQQIFMPISPVEEHESPSTSRHDGCDAPLYV